ncbi:sialidase family protein [Alienimonas californiensis]|uniref:BNR/Asp-box repeat protein n=1 Tax=Alienimonas californiensis TaxID=2527989 RepID=A0A517P718_9PLAN|nr:sialidase family protein [Alienimonas californiensis]QDT15153.1 BNR/Asp-box repeat protein [Alienimonas californiensis]
MHRESLRSTGWERRRWLQGLAATTVGLGAGGLATGRRAAAGAGAATPAAVVLSTRTIGPQPDRYAGWPTLARRSNGDLVLVFSGGREAHICPFGRVDWMVSRDDGATWSWPRTLLDSATDDRDAGVLETSRGALLVTTFTSDAWEPIFNRAANANSWPEEKRARWQAARQRLSETDRQAELGCWMIRSTDGGRSWSSRYRTPVNAPHGPIELSDGRLLYAGVQLWQSPRRVGVAQSTDDGLTWEWLAEIPARPGDDFKNYHELHAVEAPDGRLIAHIRSHPSATERETLQTHSDDGGRTWATPYSIDVQGYPSHLLKLRDGRLLMSYGYRLQPMGNRARLSDDGGRTWSAPRTISADAPSTDVGYPSTVELGDGTLLTVWYERPDDAPAAVLRQAHWRLNG